MSKFHINKHGVPAPCRAKAGNCPLGGSEQHFDNAEDAQAYIDKMYEEEYNLIPGVNSKDEVKKVFDNFEDDGGSKFMSHVGSMSYLGYLDGIENKEGVQKEFEDTFGEDNFVIESNGKDVDMMDYVVESDAINQRYQEIGYELEDEGYRGNMFDPESDEYYEDNSEFRKTYKDFQSKRQGEEVSFHGKQLSSVVNPHSKETKKFFKDYVQGNLNEDLKRDFRENSYMGVVGTSSPQPYIARTNDEFLDESLSETENKNEIKEVFNNNFEEESLVVEVRNDDPMSYSIDSHSEGVSVAYDNLVQDLNAEGYNSELLNYESEEYFETNPEFREAYSNFLKDNQGETKEIMGVNMARVEDPESPKTKQFFVDYIKRN